MKENILWQVGCEGHRPAWVVAPSWEQATVEAAKFWEAPWGQVAARCELMRKINGAATNVCCICGRVYHGKPPMCEACHLKEQTEERLDQERRRAEYIRQEKDYEKLGLKA